MTKKELLKIIEQAKRDGVTELDLSDKGLTDLPVEIGQLTNLRILHLDENLLTTLPRELGLLRKLRYLFLSRNQLTSVPSELGQITELQNLLLSDNQLTTIPGELGRLTNLRRLFLYNNQLTNVPGELGQLANLEDLLLDENQLTTIPGKLGQLTNLKNIRLNDNPLTSPPPEIVEQGTQAILEYLRGLDKASTQQWTSKLIVVGEGGVGKTSLLKALLGESFNSEEETTHGIAIRPLDLAHPSQVDVSMKLHAWDFGGQEIYHATHQFFLTNRSLFLLLWNARHGYEQGKLYYWLDTIRALARILPFS